MIARYTRPEMGKLWDLENKYQKWLDVEIAACEAWAELGEIPRDALKSIRKKAIFDVNKIDEIETPGNRMSHSRYAQAFDELPGKGENGPEEDKGQGNGHHPEKSSRAAQGFEDPAVFPGKDIAIHRTIPLP